jgi:hypothetical protein
MSFSAASNRPGSCGGTRNSSTRIVMISAITASLNASTRVLSVSLTPAIGSGSMGSCAA